MRAVALATRAFSGQLKPWECSHPDTVALGGLGRVWTACASCGFFVDPVDRGIIRRLLRAS